MNKRSTRQSSLLVIFVLLSACAPHEPREKPVINVSDVDQFSSGAIALMRTVGQIELGRDPRIVCEKRVPLGSHLAKMICMTPREIAILKKESEEMMLEVQEAQERLN